MTLKNGIFVGVWLLCAACGGASETVTLATQNGSGESGTAVLTDKGNNTTQVVLSLTLGADKGAQFNHIHLGTCQSLGGIFVPLNLLNNGSGTTTIPYALDDLKGGKYAINVHNSATPLIVQTYQACGNIP